MIVSDPEGVQLGAYPQAFGRCHASNLRALGPLCFVMIGEHPYASIHFGNVPRPSGAVSVYRPWPEVDAGFILTASSRITRHARLRSVTFSHGQLRPVTPSYGWIRLAFCFHTVEVVGSNPTAPTP